MQPFNAYITGLSEVIDPAETDRLIDRYEWFTTARRARAVLTGRADPRLTLPLIFWPTIPPVKRSAPQTGCESAEDRIIERFLRRGGYRIIPDGEVFDAEIPDASASGGHDDEVPPTEQLAEIYRSQGLYAEAEEIYRRLNMK